MTVFSDKPIKPMLIGSERDPFDDEDYYFELKLDGIRCVSYLEASSTSLFTRNGIDASEKFPDLSDINELAKKPCILDGELVILADGVPNFELIKSRTLTKSKATIVQYANDYPATLVVFDILQYDSENLMNKPLFERREMLLEVIRESSNLVVSRTVEQYGKAFFENVREQGLEGLIAKRKGSLYHPGKRTKEWHKIKNQMDDDFIICGFIYSKDDSVVSLVLGQFNQEGKLFYKGRVTLGMNTSDFQEIKKLQTVDRPEFANTVPPSNKKAVWIERKLVCKVVFIQRTDSGALRHPIYQELRFDKNVEDVIMLD